MKAKMLKGFMNGVDNFDLPRLFAEYQRAAQAAGVEFEPGVSRSFFMDTYAIQAALHMQKFGTTQRQFACSAAKGHTNGAHNPLAQYRTAMTPEDVLATPEISFPLTRAMCAPIGDGAASVLVCSEERLGQLPTAVQDRAVRIRASAMTGGYYRSIEEPSLARIAAERAYAAAELGPQDIDIVELHDASSFSEIYQLEMLGFAPEGGGGQMVESGDTAISGRLPVNPSGGLVAKGHPVGATGLSMVYELVLQLRGEAGPRQVAGARIGLQENGGGVIGLEEAACSVMLLEGPRR
jgi:acetyl-CoA acetyltransferase